MEIRFDRSRCQGHGRCYSLAPQLFEADDEGYARCRSTVVPADLQREARLAAANCPEYAIDLEG